MEILGIGIIDIDSRDCMMLRAEQTPDKAYLEKQGEDYNLVDFKELFGFVAEAA